jgi:thiol:disulfide interchange protein DsbG
MNPRSIALSLAAALLLGLVACSKQEATSAGTAVTRLAPAQAYDAVAAQARGFTAGALMAANPVYVLFDPQCPHCGHLWNASLPLHGKVRFVWVPVAIISAKSMPQGAALMQAANPVEAMSAHEQSLLSGQGGMSASSSLPPDVEAAIRVNTQLLDSLGADSVPFIVARNRRSGEPVLKAGAIETQALADLIGLEQP